MEATTYDVGLAILPHAGESSRKSGEHDMESAIRSPSCRVSLGVEEMKSRSGEKPMYLMLYNA